MRLGGRLAAAIEVLQDMEARHRPAAEALKDWGLSHRFAGSGDRAAVGNIVYDALRRRSTACWLLGEETPRAAAFGALLLEWEVDPDSLDAVLAGDRFAPQPLSDAERAGAIERMAAAPPQEIAANLPAWCVERFHQVFGEQWAREAAGLAGRPPLDLRVNTLKSDRPRVLAALGQGAEPGALVDTAIRIPPVTGDRRHPNVQIEPGFQKGWFEIQDQGSQLAARLCGAQPGMQVLDYCAGAGGKTLALAASMENRGQIFAHDADKGRLAPLFDRLRRAEARNVQVAARPQDLTPLEGRMQLVVVDAPCTGSGTWRRKPDAKWRLSERQLDARMAEQAAILDAAARYVAPGGRLAYITCSIFEEENGAQIDAFLSRTEGFGTVPAEPLWQDATQVDPAHVRLLRQGMLMSPLRTGTDGFFMAAIERQA